MRSVRVVIFNIYIFVSKCRSCLIVIVFCRSVANGVWDGVSYRDLLPFEVVFAQSRHESDRLPVLCGKVSLFVAQDVVS